MLSMPKTNPFADLALVCAREMSVPASQLAQSAVATLFVNTLPRIDPIPDQTIDEDTTLVIDFGVLMK